jgi:hypothetical protein
MVGSRRRDEAFYPVNVVAAKYDASAPLETDEPPVAYGDWRKEPWERIPSPWPLGD